MAHYYFHLRDDGERLLDPQGLWIEDAAQIAQVALREVRSLISQEALQGEINLDQRLEVEDDRGKLVHVLRFADAVRVRAPGD